MTATSDNFMNGETAAPPSSGAYADVLRPSDGKLLTRVALSNADDVNVAVQHAKAALPGWQALTMKSRAAIMFKLRHLIQEHAEELARTISEEHGKTIAESLAEVAKANETVEWACALPHEARGHMLEVSRGVTCHDVVEPLGIVASIVPFNFPLMVPCWTVPIALAAGNAVILKASEKVPRSAIRLAELARDAGVPAGVFQVIQGAAEAADAVCTHPDIAAVSFVGSSRLAEHVYKRCSALCKRVLALGGAKNHLVALPDCDLQATAADVVGSFSGCAGQRCMAASVLLLVGQHDALLEAVVARAKALKPGQGPTGEMGPVIDTAARDRIIAHIDEAERNGAQVLLDGRGWASQMEAGSWVGPTILLHTNPEDAALHDEIFGPVLSVLRVRDAEHAIQVENAHPAGNAASVYTQSGASADWFSRRFRAAQIGVNVGVAVPREPFSFGGMYGTISKFGEHDITGNGGLNFFTQRRKVTTKWGQSSTSNKDRAQFE